MITHMRRLGAAIIAIAVAGSVAIFAQTAPMTTSAVAVNAGAAVDRDAGAVHLLVGRSTVIKASSPIARVSLTTAEVADVLVTGTSELLLNGKVPGTTTMFVWDRAGALRDYEVVVDRDVPRLAAQMKAMFPAEAIDVRSAGTKVMLSGTVSTKTIIENAISLASGYVEKKDEVISLLQTRDNGPATQVLLRVRFAEVTRNALTELGASYFADGWKNLFGSVSTQQFPSPNFNQAAPDLGKSLVFSDFLNLFLFDSKNQLGAVIKALQTKGLFQSLAEPNLIAESGKEASFLAGGEFPVPVPQASAGSVAITIQFKEFGVRLNFLPTVLNGDRINLKVRPEVSTLDFANALIMQGFRIPALTTRRTETEVELQNGQTFAVAGLLNNSVTSSLRKLPGIGDIPILGLLFQSKAAQKDQTELVVMITPEILPNNSKGITGDLPRMPEPYLAPLPDKKLHDAPPPAFVEPAPNSNAAPTAAPAPAPAATQTPAAPATPATPAPDTPESAAAAVAALNPYARQGRLVNLDTNPGAVARKSR